MYNYTDKIFDTAFYKDAPGTKEQAITEMDNRTGKHIMKILHAEHMGEHAEVWIIDRESEHDIHMPGHRVTSRNVYIMPWDRLTEGTDKAISHIDWLRHEVERLAERYKGAQASIRMLLDDQQENEKHIEMLIHSLKETNGMLNMISEIATETPVKASEETETWLDELAFLRDALKQIWSLSAAATQPPTAEEIRECLNEIKKERKESENGEHDKTDRKE